MMTDITKGKIKRVIVYKLDRISRSVLDFANMMEIFQKYHVEFVLSTEKFDTSTPIGRAMLNICIVFAPHIGFIPSKTWLVGKVKQITNHVDKWDSMSFEDKQAVVDTLIKVIRIANGNIEITWRI